MPKKFGGKGYKPYLCSVLLEWYTNTENKSTKYNGYDSSKKHQFQVCRS